MGQWDSNYGTKSYHISPPQPGKFRVLSVTFTVQGTDEGWYYDQKNGIDPPGVHCGNVSLSASISGNVAGGQGSQYLGTGSHSSGGDPEAGTAYVAGWASAITWTPSGIFVAPSGIDVTIGSGSAVGDGIIGGTPLSVSWDWAYANYTFNYVDGHSNSHKDCMYGTTVSDSHTISHITNYYGNTGQPAHQVRDQSYVASYSLTVTADDCAKYPSYIPISVPGQTKYFIRYGGNIVLPTLEDYLFEGWWGTPSTRSGRGDEWLDGRSLGDHGTYNCYAHWMTSPVHERKDGVWHRWLPPDMNAQSVLGTKTVNNIRSKHEDGTWPLDKPVYERVNGEWIQRKGPMIPPDGS